jgi:hypothetical protein
MEPKPPLQGRVFNNADSFAQAFDEAWHLHSRRHPDHGLEAGEKTSLVLGLIEDHPFLRDQPELARQVAAFRVRLLGL